MGERVCMVERGAGLAQKTYASVARCETGGQDILSATTLVFHARSKSHLARLSTNSIPTHFPIESYPAW